MSDVIFVWDKEWDLVHGHDDGRDGGGSSEGHQGISISARERGSTVSLLHLMTGLGLILLLRLLAHADALVVLACRCSPFGLFLNHGARDGRLHLVGVRRGLLVAAVAVRIVLVGATVTCEALTSETESSQSRFPLTFIAALVVLLRLGDGVDVGLAVGRVGVEEGVAGGAHGLTEAGAVVPAARRAHAACV